MSRPIVDDQSETFAGELFDLFCECKAAAPVESTSGAANERTGKQTQRLRDCLMRGDSLRQKSDRRRPANYELLVGVD